MKAVTPKTSELQPITLQEALARFAVRNWFATAERFDLELHHLSLHISHYMQDWRPQPGQEKGQV